MADLTLNTLAAPTALPQAQEHTQCASPPTTFHRFMELPIEIRLLIYNELMVENVNLYRARCDSCEPREKCCRPTSLLYRKTLACAQIIWISKQICSEALPILYAKNIVHMICRECESAVTAPLWFPLAEAHDLPTDPIEHYHRHVRNIAIAYQVGNILPLDDLREFPVHWPGMESQILACYKNTEHVSLRLRLYYRLDVTFDLVRRSCKPTTERVPDYKSSLVEHSVNDPEDYSVDEKNDGTMLLAALEEMCDAVILSNAQGELRNTKFAVHSIRCKPFPPRNTKEIALYLGCHKHSASDEAIEQILAGPCLRDERRPFKAEALMELAGISDVQFHTCSSGYQCMYNCIP